MWFFAKPCKTNAVMSARGHSRRFRDAPKESGSPPIADMQRLLRHVRFVPLATSSGAGGGAIHGITSRHRANRVRSALKATNALQCSR
jgi:hypothetical protein